MCQIDIPVRDEGGDCPFLQYMECTSLMCGMDKALEYIQLK